MRLINGNQNYRKDFNMAELTYSFINALLSDKPSQELAKIQDYIDENIPELTQLKKSQQDPIHHPEGSVWNHTMLVVDEASKLLDKVTGSPVAFMLAALFHDIGKPASESNDSDGKIHTYGHDNIGAEMIPDIFKRFNIKDDTISYVQYMTKNHMRMHWLDSIKDYKVITMMIEGNMNDLLYLNTADTLGRAIDKNILLKKLKFDEKYERIAKLSNTGFGLYLPVITEDDLIQLEISKSLFQEELKIAFALQRQKKTKEQILKTLEKRKINRL